MSNNSFICEKTKQMREFWHLEYWQGYVTAAFAWLTSLMAPLWPFIGFIVFLVACDTYTGTRAAKKRGEEITSRKFSRLIEKIIMYNIAILTSEGMHRVFAVPEAITYLAAFGIAITEYKSNSENIRQVTGASILELVKSFLNINILKK